MELRPLGTSGVYVTELCLGTMTFGREADKDASAAMLDHYLEAGGNFIDTANIYADGRSEELLGELLRDRRDSVVLATKGFSVDRLGVGPNERGSTRRNLIRSLEASLRRLRTDYVDLYQLHCWDMYTPLEETLTTLDDLVRSGKVRYVGASNFQGWQLAKSVRWQRDQGWAPFVTIQPQYSLLVRDIELEVAPAALDAGLGILPWSPLGGGFLTGKYRPGQEFTDGRLADKTSFEAQRLAENRERHWTVLRTVHEVAAETGRTVSQVALNWLLSRPGVTAPIVGARTVAQLAENLGGAGWQLDAAHLRRLDDASARPRDYVSEFIVGANSRPDRRGQGAED
jgi:aryl-alcohol dehydrogenase-like predicted oxidoreductase